MQLLLASASERRLTWLKENFNDFEIISKPLISEEKSINYGVDVKQQSLEICFSKAESAALEWGSQELNDNKNPDIIIVSDTLVEDPDDSKVALGKPMDNLDATNMLLRLSGKRHKVWSSTAILVKNNKNYSKLATNWYYKIWTDFAIVEFCDLGEDDIYSLINEAKNITQKNYIDQKIIHVIVKKFIFDDQEFFEIPDKEINYNYFLSPNY